MKRLCLIVVIASLICIHTTKISYAKEQFTVLRDSYEGIELYLNLCEFKVEDSDSFAQLSFSGCSYTTEIGKPKIPLIRKLIEVPYGAEISVEIEKSTLKTEQVRRRIIPVQPSTPRTSVKTEFKIDNSFYSRNLDYPTEIVKVTEAGFIREHRIFLLEISPVSYNPQTGKVKIHSELLLKINFKNPNLTKTIHKIETHYSLPFERVVNKLILNPHCLGVAIPPPALPIGYLVITPNDFYSSAVSLADWKHRKGFNVTIAKTSDIGSSRDDIKNYISNAYNTWSVPPTFVLLLGDVNFISLSSGSAPATDFYYAKMDGDYFPDIWLSRLPARNLTDADAMVEKVINYETVNWSSGTDWAKKGYFIATSDPGFHLGAESLQKYSMYRCRSAGNMVCDSLFGYSGSGASISQAVNSGRTMVIYAGHGSTTGWGGPYFSQGNVGALSNIDMYPFVGSFACKTGSYQYDECFGEAWVKNPNGGGIAFWGASVASHAGEDDVLHRRMFDALFDSAATWMAGMTDMTKILLWTHCGGSSASQLYFRMYNLLGEPSLQLWTAIPKPLNVNHSKQVPRTPFDLWVTVRDGQLPLKDALVCATLDTLQEVGYTDSEGKVLLHLAPHIEDTMLLIVTAYNFHPYEGKIAVVAEDAYCSYLRYSINDNIVGNGDGILNPGEEVKMSFWIKNWGNSKVNATEGILRTQDPFVVLKDTLESLGDIAAGDSVNTPQGFQFSVNSNCGNNHLIKFELELSGTVNGSPKKWLSYPNVVVASPVISYLKCSINDSPPGGDGDLYPEPGETFDLTVLIENKGIATSTNTIGVLTTSDSFITINTNSANFGNIAPGASSASASYNLTLSSNCPDPHFSIFYLNLSADWFTTNLRFHKMMGSTGFFDDMENGEGDWTHHPGTSGYNDDWHLSTEISRNGTHSWKCGDTGEGLYKSKEDACLVTPPILLAPDSKLTFWHWLGTEFNGSISIYDGAIVEITTNGGATWKQIEPVGGYPYEICWQAPSEESPFPARTPCYSGANSWLPAEFDLSTYSGTIQIKFRFGSDRSSQSEGWYVDDVKVGPEEPGIEEKVVTHHSVSLQVYPNPTTRALGIRFQISGIKPSSHSNGFCEQAIKSTGSFGLSIYDLSGRLVRNFPIPNSSAGSDGQFQITMLWDAKNNEGKKVKAGIYFYQIECEGFEDRGKFVILK